MAAMSSGRSSLPCPSPESGHARFIARCYSATLSLTTLAGEPKGRADGRTPALSPGADRGLAPARGSQHQHAAYDDAASSPLPLGSAFLEPRKPETPEASPGRIGTRTGQAPRVRRHKLPGAEQQSLRAPGPLPLMFVAPDGTPRRLRKPTRERTGMGPGEDAGAWRRAGGGQCRRGALRRINSCARSTLSREKRVARPQGRRLHVTGHGPRRC